MSDVIAGNIRSAKAEHPSLGPMNYEQKSGGENKVDGGGYRASDDKTGMTNAGNIIWVFQQERGQVVLECALTSGMQAYTQNCAGSLEPTTYNFQYADGKTRKFVGRPVGDIIADEQAGTMTVTIQCKPINF